MFLYKCVGFERRKICANVSNSIWYFLYQYRVFHSAQWSSVCSNLQFDHSMHGRFVWKFWKVVLLGREYVSWSKYSRVVIKLSLKF